MEKASDDSVTDAVKLLDITNVDTQPKTTNETDGSATGPASGLTQAGTMIWERKKAVNQSANNPEEICATYTLRRNLAMIPPDGVRKYDLHSLVEDSFTGEMLDRIFRQYSRWSIQNLHIQLHAVANWWNAGGSMLIAYMHDPERFHHTEFDGARQADMYLTRITDCRKVHLPVRQDWFYTVQPTHRGRSFRRLCSPGGIVMKRRGVKTLPVHFNKEYKVVATLHATINFGIPTIASEVAPRYYEQRYFKVLEVEVVWPSGVPPTCSARIGLAFIGQEIGKPAFKGPMLAKTLTFYRSPLTLQIELKPKDGQVGDTFNTTRTITALGDGIPEYHTPVPVPEKYYFYVAYTPPSAYQVQSVKVCGAPDYAYGVYTLPH